MKQKLVIGFILLSIFLTTVSGILLPTKPAHALFGVGDVTFTTVVADIPSRIWNTLSKALKIAGDVAYKNALRYFLSKVAYDTATYIATGGAGQKPLFITDFKQYFKNTADEAAGVFFEKLSKGGKGYCDNAPSKQCSTDRDCPGAITLKEGEVGPTRPAGKCIGAWGGTGIDLCEPLDPLSKIQITISAKKSLEPQRPRCTWTEIKKNLKDAHDLKLVQLPDLASSFHPGANDLGAYISIRTAADEAIRKNTQEKNLQSIIEGGFKSVTNPITGAIKTPASAVANMLNLSMDKAFVPQETYTGSPVADAIGVFTNTLVSKYLERIFKKGFNPQADGGGQTVVDNFWTIGGTAAARQFFGELAEPSYRFNVGMDLNEFVAEGSGQFAQVIDDQFSRAIEDKCTVGQAAGYYKAGEAGYRPECANLVSNTGYLGYDENGTEISSFSARGIPYRSILVLRKFRVIPVGWELAAQYYKLYDNKAERLNLNKLFREYSNPASPYYKLVDPDWVLKFPATRCVREGSGPEIPDNTIYYAGCKDQTKSETECPAEDKIYSFQRNEYCADYQTCLTDKSNGSCDLNDWGYCVEEKPIWQIKGTECKQKQYATCQSVTNTGSKQRVTYLLNTVSDLNGVCDSTNVGCREYCLDFSVANKNWTCSAVTGNKTYLTAAVDDCSAKNEGCHLFYASAAKKESEVNDAFSKKETDQYAYGLLIKNYIKLAPSYDNCQGYTQPITGIATQAACVGGTRYWREDIKRCVASGGPECADFAKQCLMSDVGCQLYTPLTTKDPAVPAVIQSKVCTGECTDDLVTDWKDECPASCVGYTNYRQIATNFESASDQSFIAKTGKSCSQPGCDQFTNLDVVAKGGEGIEYYSFLRRCVKPSTTSSNQKAYYTWEGSDVSGYQLKKWILLKSNNSNAPAGQSCGSLTDADCREFFDTNLQSYKIYYSSTTVVTEECYPFRKTVATQTDCTNSGGSWENSQCIYMGMPSESKICAANNNLCREYRTNRGYNYQKIVESYFSQNDLGGWTGAGTISNESVRRGDYSMEVSGEVAYTLTTGDLEAGRTYTLEFLAKSKNNTGRVTVEFAHGAASVSNTVILSNSSEWQFYAVRIPNNPEGLVDVLTANKDLVIAPDAGKSFYIDNIVLKKMDSILLIKNSWQTPAICDTPTVGTHLGCQTYRHEGNKKQLNLRRFSKLCFEDVAGCELAIDSKNTSVLTDDTLSYMVLDKKYKCNEDQQGCTRVGLITPETNNQNNYTFENKYKIINPADNTQICQANEVFCQKFQDDENNVYYFKDPFGRTCEFKKVGENYDWYKLGTDELCQSAAVTTAYTKHCLGGHSTASNNTCTADNQCTNLAYPDRMGICTDWVGLCDQNSSGCREYLDQNEPVGCSDTYLNFDPRAGSGDDLLVGGDFENDLSYWNIDTNYRNQVSLVKNIVHTGSRALQINLGANSHALWSRAIRVSAGQKYTLSGWFYNLSSKIKLWAVWNNVVDGNVLFPVGQWSANAVNGLNAGGKWQFISGSFAAPSGAQELHLTVGVDQGASGVLYVDDLRIKESEICNFYYYKDVEECNQTADPTKGCVGFYQTDDLTTRVNNKVLEVERDRECDKWLYCRSSLQVVNNKKETENLCFDIGVCDERNADGDCVKPINISEIKKVQEFNDPEDVRNLSGLAKVGFDWGSTSAGSRKIDGYYHYANMKSVGTNIQIDNGNFEMDELGDWNKLTDGNGVQWKSTQLNIVADPSGGTNKTLKITKATTATADGWVNATLPIGWISSVYNYAISMNIMTKSPGAVSDIPRKVRVQLLIRKADGGYATSTLQQVETENYWQKKIVLSDQTGSEFVSGETKKGQGYLNIGMPKSELGTDGAIYIDNLDMNFVLQVADNKYEERSCRLYPTDVAPACDYNDGRKQYTGWKGFCVEQDPKYANQEPENQLCLNWWPIDILAGDANVFGANDVQAGYMGDKYLYYCLEAKGDYPYYHHIILNTKQELYHEDQENTSFNVAALNLAKDDILEIRISNLQIDNNNLDYHNDCSINNNLTSIGWTGEGNPSMTTVMGKSGKGDIVFNDVNKNYWNRSYADLDWEEEHNASGCACKYNRYAGLRCGDVGAENDMNISSAWLTFDSNNILTNINFTHCDGSPGWGAAKFDLITITFKGPRCDVVGKVVDNYENAAWSARILKDGWQISAGNAVNYKYDQDFPPYGAAVSPTPPSNPTIWSGGALYVMLPDKFGTNVSPYQARAGSPQAIKPDSNLKRCSNSKSSGKICTTNTDCDYYDFIPMAGWMIIESGVCSPVSPTGNMAGKTQCIAGDESNLGKECDPVVPGSVSCGENGVCAGLTLTSAQTTAISGDRTAGKDRISKLFAKSYGVWAFNTQTGKYDAPLNSLNWDLTTTWNNLYKPAVTNIKVGDKAGGEVVVQGPKNLILRFNTNVNENHLPLTDIWVDWGDGTNLSQLNGLRIAPRTDESKPHTFTHIFECQRGYTGWQDTCIEYGIRSGGCCVYVPSIQIKDNWGWCNNGSAGNLCPDPSDKTNWAKFNGKVIVRPR